MAERDPTDPFLRENDELVRTYLQRTEAVCPTCGYGLRGVPVARCPECGRELDVELLRDGSEAAQRPTNEPSPRAELGGELSPWWWLILAPLFLGAFGVVAAFLLGWIR